MITHRMLIPNGLERRFGRIRSIEQISRAETYERARDDTIGAQHTSRPEGLFHRFHLLIHIFRRDWLQVSADYHVRPPIDPTRDKWREPLPVTMRKLLERHNRYDRVRVGCHKADERFRIELGKVRRDHLAKRETSHDRNRHQYPGG